MALDGIQACKHHGLDLLKARQRLRGGVAVISDRVTDFGIGNSLNVREEKPSLARREFICRNGFGRLVSETLYLIDTARRPQPNFLTEPEPSIDNTNQDDDAAVWIEP